MATLTYTDQLQIIVCGSCQCPFAIPDDLYRRCLADGSKPFWCPRGCKVYFLESENAKLKKQLENERRWRENADTRARAARDQAEAAERRARGYKGVATKLRKRAAAGVCPCCHRSFRALRDHMETEHPGFADDDALTTEPPEASRAECQRCHREVQVRGDGTLRTHNRTATRGDTCAGSRKAPAGG